MKKAIVTTTINAPTKALEKFIKIAKDDSWSLVIVGDKKTPHEDFEALAEEHEFITYLSPEYQEKTWPKLSELIGWNCIQRRNFGLVFAYNIGAEIIATVDDDNIPVDNWGKKLIVGTTCKVNTFKVADAAVFDPLAATHPHIWHRGFPVQLLDKRNLKKGEMVERKVLVQADMWDGDPDVDAIARITLLPEIQFNPNTLPFAGDKISPFNSQNTFLHRDIFPTYFLFPHIGRMDDIWAAYVTQHEFPDCVAYCKASVYQDRNEHDLVKDLKAEMIGYEHSLEVATDKEAYKHLVPQLALDAYEEYKKAFHA